MEVSLKVHYLHKCLIHTLNIRNLFSKMMKEMMTNDYSLILIDNATIGKTMESFKIQIHKVRTDNIEQFYHLMSNHNLLMFQLKVL